MKLGPILMRYGIFGKLPLEPVTKLGRDVYRVPSRQRADIAHTTDLEKIPQCSCEDFTINKEPNCFHVRFVRALIEAKII